MPVFKIHHITQYTYDQPVTDSVNEIRILPFQGVEQEILKHDLMISQHPELYSFDDYWGNRVATFSITEPHQELVIESQLTIRTLSAPQIQVNFHSNFQDLQAEIAGNMMLLELIRPEQITKQAMVDAICSMIDQPELSVAQTVERCSEYIFKYFKYTKGITSIETTLDEILEHQGGVCQDFAHLLLQILRSKGIPCRYVSGYICPNKNGMRGEGATHAWIEAYIPQFGWAGIDPTNNVWITNNHVKLAVGRDFRDCTPVKGTFRGVSHQSLYVFVSVGYEDGHTFQETHQVQMDKEEAPLTIASLPPTPEDMMAQQQQ